MHRWMCHTGWRRTRLVRPVCHEAWPGLSLGMKYSQWQRAVVGRREASAQRSARAAPRLGAEVGYASLGVPLPCFLPFVLGNAQSADREDTGIHRRCSLAKIGAESEELVLEQQLGCGAHRENEIACARWSAMMLWRDTFLVMPREGGA